ncbi:MAG: DUF481 domain-containing protein [Proteobacteria bacterium]|nr:DUF481 domain-containing protein [Pseudomonadota bacterium]
MQKTETVWACLATILLALGVPHDAEAAKTDVVVLINGDAVTGEIKSLDFGALRYGTDSMGTVTIEWEEIVWLKSNQSLQVEVASGTRYFGGLFATGTDGVVGIGRGENIQEIDLSQIVRITPIETDEKIWQRFEGSVKFGFNSDKASQVTVGNLSANVRYRARTYLLGLDLVSSVTDQPGAETTQNQSLNLNYQRFRDNRWFTDWFTSAERNDEQGVDRRLSVGGGLGKYLVQSNKNQFSLLVGLVATRTTLSGIAPELPIEGSEPADTNSDTTDAEAKFSVKYLHRSLEPSSDMTFTTDVFPQLQDFSSFRSNTNLTLRREIIDDLFFDLSFYYTYLSKPPVGAEKDDYGVVTSIGYSF